MSAVAAPVGEGRTQLIVGKEVKAEALKPIYENIPEELKAYDQWVAWVLVWDAERGKVTKPPVKAANGYSASVTDKTSWKSYKQAETYCKSNLGFYSAPRKHGPVAGPGFVLTDSVPFVGIDIDHCVSPDGSITSEAQKIIDRAQSYTEISPSGTGIRIFIKAKISAALKNDTAGVEIYGTGRYLTVTGHAIKNLPIAENQGVVDFIFEEFGKKESDKHLDAQEKVVADSVGRSSLSDQKVLNKAVAAKNGTTFSDLFHGSTTEYESQSAADQALCNLLAFWCRKDAPQMDRIFRSSGLMRPKWDEMRGAQTYGQMTIDKAIADVREVYSPEGAATKKNSDSRVSPQMAAMRAVLARLGGQENVIYAQEFFWTWTGKYWRRCEDLEIRQRIQEVERENEKFTATFRNGVFELLKGTVYRAEFTFDNKDNPVAVAVENGELYWTGSGWELRPPVREHYRTVLLPVVYDPQADALRFRQFLNEIFAPDDDLEEKKRLLLECIGYTLWPRCEYEKFVILYGRRAANGKTKVTNLLTSLVGSGNVCAVEPSQFKNRFQLAHLNGKLLNAVSELSFGSDISDTELKKICSGELITAEHKNKPPFEFRPYATCWFGTNHLPSTRDSNGTFRRAIIIPFERVFEEHEQDVRLDEKLRAELSGILNLALEAFGGVLQRGIFTSPPSCAAAKADWRKESDDVAAFVEECCEQQSDASLPVGELFMYYDQWCTACGIKNPIDKRHFSKRMIALGAVAKREGKACTRVLQGFALVRKCL